MGNILCMNRSEGVTSYGEREIVLTIQIVNVRVMQYKTQVFTDHRNV